MIWFFGLICWTIGALVVAKLDAALCGDRTDSSRKFWAFFTWPIVGVLLIYCKHHINNGGQNDWDY